MNNNLLKNLAIWLLIGFLVFLIIDFYKANDSSRKILPISLSYDHRIIDGAEAAKFCNSLKENLGKNFAYNLAF